MNKYETIVRQQEKFKNSTQQTLQVYRKDKKLIDVEEVIKLATGLQAVGDSQGKKTSLLIRGSDKAGEHTIKGYDENLQSIDEYLDYFSNRVKSTAKFNGFYQLQITVVSYNDGDRKDLGHYKVKHADTYDKPEKKVTKAIFDKKSKK